MDKDATPWWMHTKDWFTQALPLMLLLLFVLFGAAGYFVTQSQVNIATLEARQEAQERVVFEQCRSDNDTRELIGEVLDAISEPRRFGETEERYLARIQVFEEAKELLVLNECPPRPDDVE